MTRPDDLLAAPSGYDRTLLAVRRWLAALPAPTYLLRLKPAEGGPVVSRRFTADQLLNAIPWLRRQNAQDHHVYARPDVARHILIDDADPDALDQILLDHKAAVVIETSPYNHQIFLTLDDDEIPHDLAGAAARLLARKYGTDPGAAAALQLGRLPGFTNRKPLYERGSGLYWHVRVRQAACVVDPTGPLLLAEALQDLEARGHVTEARSSGLPSRQRLRLATSTEEYARAKARVQAGLQRGVTVDRSRLDYALARRLLARGATPEAVAAALAAGPKASELPALAAERYVARTLAAAQRTAGRGGPSLLITPRLAPPGGKKGGKASSRRSSQWGPPRDYGLAVLGTAAFDPSRTFEIGGARSGSGREPILRSGGHARKQIWALQSPPRPAGCIWGDEF